MTRSNAPKIIAALTAVATTLVLFSAVANLADSDQSTLLAAKIAPTKLVNSR